MSHFLKGWQMRAWHVVSKTAGVILGVIAVATARGDELPNGAANVLERLNQQVTRVERTAEAQIADVMRQVYAIEDEAAEEARSMTVEAIDKLKMLQEQYTRDGMLDDALAVRELVRSMEAELEGVEITDAPQTIGYNSEVGQIFYYRLTGDADYGSVWGSGIYTYDSFLAVAAVHAGVLRDGESGLVKVTVLPGQENYLGEERHGITSYEYGMYSLSYRIEAASPVVRSLARRAQINADRGEAAANSEGQ